MSHQDPEKDHVPRARHFLGLSLIVLVPLLIAGALVLLLFLLVRLQWTGDRAGLLLGLVMGLTLTAVSIITAVSKRLRLEGGKRKLASDTRPPVLYLRSFQDDQTPITATDTHENNLASVLEEIGPVVAIGRPGDRLSPSGAERMYVKDEDWRQEIAALMSRARVVVIQAGTTDGLLWEINAATRNLNPEQILISLRTKDRPIKLFGRSTYQHQYDKFRSLTSQVFRHSLPESVDGATFLGFDGDWTPRLLKPRRWKPYNLAPAAKIRETIRPHLEKQGVKLGTARTKIQGFLMALLLAVSILLILGGAVAILVN